MDWHGETPDPGGEPAGSPLLSCNKGWGGYTWNRTLFADPVAFQRKVRAVQRDGECTLQCTLQCTLGPFLARPRKVPLGAAACCSLFLLTCALWVTPPRPKVHDEWGLNLILNTHDQCGVQSTQGALYKAVAHDMGVSVSGNTTIPCHLQDERYVDSLWTHAMRSDENTGVDYWWTDLCDLGTPGQGEGSALA